MSKPIRVGVLRLVDSAPIIVAQTEGMFAALGLTVEISIEPSWSNITDKLTYGLLDVAVMLPPLALAACGGLRGPKARLIVPLSLSQGGNTIVLAHATADTLSAGTQPPRMRLLEWLRSQPTRPRFAVVHAFSTHNLLLRYWLALGGGDPDRDIETVVIPPEDAVNAMATGRITGFCVGAPWGHIAEHQGVGRILSGTSVIWPFHPEKCLCASEAWAEANPDLLHYVLRALLRAQIHCDQPDNAASIASRLADPDWLHLPEEASRTALAGGSGPEHIRFHARGAWFPAQAHAVWFLGQMRRWRWLDAQTDLEALAATVYRPDLLASAVEAEGLYAAAALPSLEGSAMLPQPDEAAFGSGRGIRRPV
ncbi:CmpA/NrtA family ABC transporter substrate-binding protein [Rhodopila sp.]|uniref:CmpA/NrtA family ABC transporter substrate-binding protein n=1 Tax=Rhodopila sp. TaxID=2480087 RepID=UPI003D111B78